MYEPIVTIVGNLVADPELRIAQSGKPWVTFRIASTPRVRDRQSDQWVEGETLWVGCRAFGEHAENIASSLVKGTRVVVYGRLTSRRYIDSQGQERTTLELDTEEVGPCLRFATAQVARVPSRSGGGGAGSSYNARPQSGGWNEPTTSQNSGWGNAQSEQVSSPWASNGDDDFGDEAPF